MYKKLIKHVICRHWWQANYLTGEVTCLKCGKVSEKNYYKITINEKF